MRDLVVIPTYNEAENIGPLVTAIASCCTNDCHVLVVDDNSPDGTSRIVRDLTGGADHHLSLIVREQKDGLGGAYLAGFKWGLENGYDRICEMDADFSHDPAYLPKLFELAGSHDFVIGSRYVAGGGVADWGIVRRLVSKIGSLYARIVLGGGIRDFTGGFNCWNRRVLEAIDLESIVSNGYLFQIELKHKARKRGFSFAEMPILFKDRQKGVSKMNLRIVAEALLRIWTIRIPHESSIAQFIMFSITGFLGTVTNALLFFLLVDLGGVNHDVGAVAGFAIAVTQNFFLNRRFTFGIVEKSAANRTLSYLKYVAVSLAGLTVNLVVLNWLVGLNLFSRKTPAQLIGIVAGTVINFVGSKYFAFRKRRLAK